MAPDKTTRALMDDAPAATRSPGPAPLAPAQVAMIGKLVELADNLGVPRSLAQIYGLLFTSSRPLDAQACADILQISRSSAGQGLRTLKDLGAIRSTFELGNRSEHYAIEPDLGVLLKSILEGRLIPSFQKFFDGVETISTLPPTKMTPFLKDRIEKLHRWEKKLEKLSRLSL